mmetsp:Transcript_13062/g.31728  ORF Transcript_13062/g.31728 Transcript_13062/m.31728 type:complete len:238 (-) Transcript_13062:35-748(-)
MGDPAAPSIRRRTSAAVLSWMERLSISTSTSLARISPERAADPPGTSETTEKGGSFVRRIPIPTCSTAMAEPVADDASSSLPESCVTRRTSSTSYGTWLGGLKRRVTLDPVWPSSIFRTSKMWVRSMLTLLISISTSRTLMLPWRKAAPPATRETMACGGSFVKRIPIPTSSFAAWPASARLSLSGRSSILGTSARLRTTVAAPPSGRLCRAPRGVVPGVCWSLGEGGGGRPRRRQS